MMLEYLNAKKVGKELRDLSADQKLVKLKEIVEEQWKVHLSLGEYTKNENLNQSANAFYSILQVIREMLNEDQEIPLSQPLEQTEESRS